MSAVASRRKKSTGKFLSYIASRRGLSAVSSGFGLCGNILYEIGEHIKPHFSP